MKIRLIYTEDWQVLIIDNQIIIQNHNLSANNVLEAMFDLGLIDYNVEKYLTDESLYQRLGDYAPKETTEAVSGTSNTGRALPDQLSLL